MSQRTRDALLESLELLEALRVPSQNGPPEGRPNMNAAFIKAREIAEKAAKAWVEDADL